MVARLKNQRKCPLRLARWLTVALLLAASQPGAGQSAPTIDSLKQALRTARDTTRIKLLYQLKSELGNNNYAEALAYAQQGLAASERLHWPWGRAQGLEDVGRLLGRQGNHVQAQQHLLAALALWRALHQERRAVRTMLYIGRLLGVNKQFDKALIWGKQALAGARATHDTAMLVRASMGLGMLHGWQHQPAASLPYYRQALALAHQKHLGAEINPASVLNNMADAYIELKRPQEAFPCLFEALRLARKRNDKGISGTCEATLAQAYGQTGKRSMAIYHARLAHELSAASKDVLLLITVNNMLDTLYLHQGNYRLSRQYLAENRALEAQVREQEQAQKVAEVQGRYDTREKERDIKLLTQQNQIAQLATQQQRTLCNAALVIAGLLLLAVGILYNRYRLRQRTVKLLDEQNREKQLLLQEVHHRVKNNLQIVLSLLDTQLDTLFEPAAAAAIRDSQSRVQTMALIHQHLYQSDSLARIDMRRYLAELLDAIGRAYRRNEVSVVLHVASVHLTTHTAVPLGLIINELVTNAYKYAFAGRTHNLLQVELSQTGPAAYCLVVADNGVGLPPIDLDLVQSLGLQLTVGLLQQMHAQFAITRSPGTRFTIHFHEVADADLSPARRPAKPAAPAQVSV